VLTTVAASHAPGSGRAAIVSGFSLGFWLATGLCVVAAILVLGALRRVDAASVQAPTPVPPETSPGMVT
jgi:hypothetical protein